MAKIKVDPAILQKTPYELGEMSFGEIAFVLNIREGQAEKIFNQAMAKLGSPSIARELWEYKNIDAGEANDKNKTRL